MWSHFEFLLVLLLLPFHNYEERIWDLLKYSLIVDVDCRQVLIFLIYPKKFHCNSKIFLTNICSFKANHSINFEHLSILSSIFLVFLLLINFWVIKISQIYQFLVPFHKYYTPSLLINQDFKLLSVLFFQSTQLKI